jgi:hypothetical protein
MLTDLQAAVVHHWWLSTGGCPWTRNCCDQQVGQEAHYDKCMKKRVSPSQGKESAWFSQVLDAMRLLSNSFHASPAALVDN